MLIRYSLYLMGLASSCVCAMNTVDPRDLDMDDVREWEILKTYNFGCHEEYQRCIPSPQFAQYLQFTGHRTGVDPVVLTIFPVQNYRHQDFLHYANKEQGTWFWLSGDRQWRVELRKVVDGTKMPSFRLQSQRRMNPTHTISVVPSTTIKEIKQDNPTTIAYLASRVRSWCCACRKRKIHES